MPSFNTNFTILANATNENLIAGSAFEYLELPTRVTIAWAQNGDQGAPANVVGDLIASVSIGGQVVQEAGSVLLERQVGSGPSIDQDAIIDDVFPAGRRVKLTVQNTTGNVRDIRLRMRFLYT